jgi:hypothetical protein
MSTNLENFIWPAEFSCTIITQNVIVPNYYSIKVGIEPNGQNQESIVLGFKKINHFVENCLHNSIMVNQNNPILSSFLCLETNIVYLPTEPYDHFLGSLLYRKFTSIGKKHFHIVYLGIDSIVGSRIQYNIRSPADCGLDLKGNFWWNMDNANTGAEQDVAWNDLDISETSKFEPRVIRGGLSED